MGSEQSKRVTAIENEMLNAIFNSLNEVRKVLDNNSGNFIYADDLKEQIRELLLHCNEFKKLYFGPSVHNNCPNIDNFVDSWVVRYGDKPICKCLDAEYSDRRMHPYQHGPKFSQSSANMQIVQRGRKGQQKGRCGINCLADGVRKHWHKPGTRKGFATRTIVPCNVDGSDCHKAASAFNPVKLLDDILCISGHCVVHKPDFHLIQVLETLNDMAIQA